MTRNNVNTWKPK